ncbi:type I restriction endonuclease subunit R [Acetobacterium malicum]|uniref:type I restriction endonuclease subunit R n=1 Tax=Acetobacterium malicum TaxID=52692 RepID=UPI0035933FD3
MSYLGNEYTLVEKPALDYLTGNLGYDYVEGEKLTPSFGERESLRDGILIKRFRMALSRLNPWMTVTSLDSTIKYFTNSDALGTSLLAINEKIHRAIVDLEFTVTQSVEGQKKKLTVKLIDFEDVENNDFLVTNQFAVQGLNKTIYPDLVIFINGLPIVVIEAKSPFKEGGMGIKAGKKDAYDQLCRYMDSRSDVVSEGAQKLFHTNFFTAIINKYHAYAGTITAGYDYYLEWKDPYPFKVQDMVDLKNNGQNLFLQGLLEKQNLLLIMQFFVLFETEGDIRIKKLARYQQFRACMKAIKRIQAGKTPLEKGGVIWHTQGSGKSLSMVMLARMIRRTKGLEDTMLVIITDRIDLDKQLYHTFKGIFPATYTMAKSNLDKMLTRAETVEEMKALLSAGQAKIICTTIQKFQCETDEQPIFEDGHQAIKLFFDKAIEVLTNKSNVIVFTDEAHRSQYSNLSMNMRKALPNATFIGFTGTPIEKEDKSTYRTFGELIDSYTISQAVEDGNTVAIVYEGRRQDLQIIQEQLDEDFDEEFRNKSDLEREAIKVRYFNKITLAEADDRIDDIARDLLIHYRDNSYKLGFKAQVVTVSRLACVKYYNALMKHMPSVFGDNPIEIAVIFSADNNDALMIKNHRTSKGEQDLILARFKREIEKDRLCMIIVKDMLLTGFDAKIEDVMYLDRPLKEHNLLQAIARVNRTYDKSFKQCDENGKEVESQRTKAFGRVVDYFGVTRHLEEALQIFDTVDVGEPMENIDSLYRKMLDYKEQAMRMFDGVDKSNLDALMNVLEPANIRAEFETAYKRFAVAVNTLMPTHVTQDDLNALKWLSYLRAGAKARFEPEDAIDISDCGEKARELISEHLKSQGVYQWIEPITLFDKDFKEKIYHGSDEAIASTMEHAIKHIITVKMKENPVHYQTLLERLLKLIEETNLNWEERRKQLEEFVERELNNGEEELARDLGFTQKRQLAIYETIKNSGSPSKVEDGGATYTAGYDEDVFKDITMDIEKTILDNRVRGFKTNPTRLSEMETAIYEMLLGSYYTVLGYDGVARLINPIMDLAKIHYGELD